MNEPELNTSRGRLLLKYGPDAAPHGAGRFSPFYRRLTPWAKGRRPLRGLITGAGCLRRRAFRLLLSAFCLLLTAYCLLPTVLSAQGCAMCYNSASAAKAGAKEALANGVLILLVPPMLFFALITVVVYMYRNKFREMSVVSGPLSVARRSNDPEFRRWDDPSAEAPDFSSWSPDHPISDDWSPIDSVGVRRSDIGSPDPLPRTTDNGLRTKDKHFHSAG